MEFTQHREPCNKGKGYQPLAVIKEVLLDFGEVAVSIGP
jgi:hypothetical protein